MSRARAAGRPLLIGVVGSGRAEGEVLALTPELAQECRRRDGSR